MTDWCAPGIAIAYTPPYGDLNGYLEGQVWCVDPAAYQVAVFIYVSGWWTKPYWAWPLTTIRDDGSWTCDVTTGGIDELATKFAAFLLPTGYEPPLMSGGQALPQELFDHAAAYITVNRPAVLRQIEFSGYTWNVKASESQAGPGPCYYSDRPEDVWVDASGRLHLRIAYRSGRWYCTEVINTGPIDHGTYTFSLASRVDQLDKNVVLGLFTWDEAAPQFNFREIDIEFSRWGSDTGENAQYVVQPWDRSGNRYRFNMVLGQDHSTHSFTWLSDRIAFSSYEGQAPGSSLIEEWQYTGPDIPPAGGGNARINLWLLNGEAPSDGNEVEAIIEAFAYAPGQ